MSLSSEFPILDLAGFNSDFKRFAEDLYAASNRWGFLVITNSGIDPGEIFDLSRAFFNLSTEVKAEKTLNESAIGYDGRTQTTFAASEGMTFGSTPGGILATDHLPEWWNREKRETIESFKSQCYDLSIKLMSCFAHQLGLEKDYFQQAHKHKDPGNNLKLIRYPPIETDSDQGIPRLSEHTDWGSITFVFTTQGGLEIRDPNNNWFHVPVIRGGIVVNIGDALSLWSGKVLKSTLHRITWENLPKDKDRYSIAYFTNPNYDAVLNPSASLSSKVDTAPALTYRDYYQVRLRLTYGSLQDEGTGEKVFADIEPAVLDAVKKLNVANSGVLESNAISV